MAKISASLWSADLTNLASEIKKMDKQVDSFHFDIGDGHYIYRLLFFPDLIKSLRSKTKLPFEIHLMVNDPEKYLKAFRGFADTILFHPESSNGAKKLIKEIKKYKIGVGIVIKTNETIESFEELIDQIDKVILMGTKLGVKGEGLDKRILIKIRKLKNYLKKTNNTNVVIEIDGGIREHNVPLIIKMGADSIVAGSLIFNKDYKKISKWIHSL